MGNSSNKKKPLETHSRLRKEINCPLCNKPFNKSSTYSAVIFYSLQV